MARKRQAIHCKAIKEDGSACGGWAITGGDLCAWHGGRRKAIKRAAAERAATAQALDVVARYNPGAVDAPADVPAALAAIIGETRSFASFMGQRLAELSGSEWHYSHPDRAAIRAEVSLYQKALDHASRVLVDVARLGVEAAIVQQAARLERSRAEAVITAFDAATAGLDPDLRHQLSTVFAAFLLHGGKLPISQ